MKIAIGYPPIETTKGIPQISQNRQFQWTASGPAAYFIYPIIPASAATLLKSKGYEVVWLDGLAEKWSYERWLKEVKKEQPDLIMLEAKTPVIKKYWEITSDLKKLKIENCKLKIVLVGDHVTALPRESMENCSVDYILTGGDYDFLLLELCNFLKNNPVSQFRGKARRSLASGKAASFARKASKYLPSGIYYRDRDKVKNTGKFQLTGDLDSLPMIDRDLTKWQLYAYKNSNFYRAPGAYTMFGRDCWWGKCSFCSWTTLFPGSCYRVIKVKKALDEIGQLIEKYHLREIMDDSGTFPVGEWLREFCQGMIKRDYNKKIRINCNMRFNAGLSPEDYQLMGKAGFRFVLYGLESASQKTLDKVNKNLKIEQIEPVLKWAKKAGLMPHLTVMIGYPWEDEKDVQNTIALAERLFKNGLADSMQATIIIPYPGTFLFDYCQKNGLLKTKNWDRYDMRETVIKTKASEKKLLAAIRGLYSHSIWTPRFIINTLFQLKSIDGIKYVSFQALKYFGKLWQFK